MNRSFAKRMLEPARLAQEDIGEVSAVAHESIDGALVVKTLGREDAETARLGEKAESLRQHRVIGGYDPGDLRRRDGLLPRARDGGAARDRLVARVAGAITVGDLIGFVALLGLLSWPMRFIGWILAELPRAVVGYARLQTGLRRARDRGAARPRRTRCPRARSGSRSTHVRHLFDGIPVLDDVSFRIEPEESVAIVGPTGVGKSHARPAPGAALRSRTRARILVGGVDVRRADPLALRRDVSIVFQESFLFATTVADEHRAGRRGRRGRRRARGADRGRPTASSASCPTATTRSSASAGTRSPAGSASGSPSRGR